jgi:hypothetical protein
MMGLEKLLRGLYGSDPQLDMDRQFARVRVPKPMEFDFAALADGIKRNNVGTAAILVEAVAVVEGGRVKFARTGQTFPLEGSASPEAARRRFRVLDWEDKAKTRLEFVP